MQNSSEIEKTLPIVSAISTTAEEECRRAFFKYLLDSDQQKVEEFLKLDPNLITARNQNGLSPLFCAVLNNDLGMTTFLLNSVNNARIIQDTFTSTLDGATTKETVEEFAIRMGIDDSIIKLLIREGKGNQKKNNVCLTFKRPIREAIKICRNMKEPARFASLNRLKHRLFIEAILQDMKARAHIK